MITTKTQKQRQMDRWTDRETDGHMNGPQHPSIYLSVHPSTTPDQSREDPTAVRQQQYKQQHPNIWTAQHDAPLLAKKNIF